MIVLLEGAPSERKMTRSKTSAEILPGGRSGTLIIKPPRSQCWHDTDNARFQRSYFSNPYSRPGRSQSSAERVKNANLDLLTRGGREVVERRSHGERRDLFSRCHAS